MPWHDPTISSFIKCRATPWRGPTNMETVLTVYKTGETGFRPVSPNINLKYNITSFLAFRHPFPEEDLQEHLLLRLQ